MSDTDQTSGAAGGSGGDYDMIGMADVKLLAKVVNHPEFEFNPIVHKTLANKLFLIFENLLPRPQGGDWPDRTRVKAAEVLVRLSDHNLKRLSLIAQIEQSIEWQRQSSRLIDDGHGVTIEQRIVAIRSAVVGELTRRGLPVPAINGDGAGGDGRPASEAG